MEKNLNLVIGEKTLTHWQAYLKLIKFKYMGQGKFFSVTVCEDDRIKKINSRFNVHGFYGKTFLGFYKKRLPLYNVKQKRFYFLDLKKLTALSIDGFFYVIA